VTAGRPRKPTALKLLAGNPGKRRLPDREPHPGPLEGALAEPPDWMPRAGRELWQRIVPRLARLGVATECDVEALELLCSSWSDWREAREVLEREGLSCEVETRGGRRVVARPEVAIAAAAAQRVTRLLSDFGLTPASRSRVTALGPPGERDPMTELLERRT